METKQKGDTVECLGFGYPHWKGKRFTVNAISDGSQQIVIKNGLMVATSDFKKITQHEQD